MSEPDQQEAAKPVGKYKCRGCDYTAATKWTRIPCPGCGRWYNIISKTSADAASSSASNLVSQLKRPEFISTGIPGFNRVLGGGLTKGTTILLVGGPSAGKTTVLLQILDYLAAKYPCLYATAEQRVEALTPTLFRINDKPSDKLHIIKQHDLHEIFEFCTTHKIFCCVLDSLQKLYRGDFNGSEGSTEQVSALIEGINSYAQEMGTIFIVINRVNKKHEFAGTETTIHEVDAVLNLRRLGGKKSQVRVLDIGEGKTRFGVDTEEAYFIMTDKGLVQAEWDDVLKAKERAGEDVDEEDDPEPPKPRKAPKPLKLV